MSELVKLFDADFATVERSIRAALAERGFGILTEIDVAATLKNKLGVNRSALKILGACNPTFAHQALEIDPSVALFMPCNVVIEQLGDKVQVSAMDPSIMMGSPETEAIAQEAQRLLGEAVQSVE